MASRSSSSSSSSGAAASGDVRRRGGGAGSAKAPSAKAPSAKAPSAAAREGELAAETAAPTTAAVSTTAAGPIAATGSGPAPAPASASALALRLVETAIEQFGRHGFDGASTRDIAAACGTAMSSITYHFGGKQGLYLACADHIADKIEARRAPALAAIRAHPPGTVDEARAALLTLLENFARLMLAPESESWSQFMVREQQRPTEAFGRLYARIMKPVLDTALGFIRITRPSLSEEESRVLVMNMVGMALILRIGRACVSRTMGVDDLDEATANTLIAGLRRSALHLLTETTA